MEGRRCFEERMIVRTYRHIVGDTALRGNHDLALSENRCLI